MNKITMLIAGAMMIAAPVYSAAADSYPENPVRLIIPFNTGGMVGNMGNLLANNLSQHLGSNFVVEPRPGAGGAIGFDYVKNARKDGYVLLMGTISTAAILPAIRDDLPFDTLKDFEPIGHFASGENLFMVPSSSSVTTLKELIEFGMSDDNPTCGTFGMGSTAHLGCELLNREHGTRFTTIHYTGSAPALTALIGGEISFLVGTSNSIDFILDGSVRAVAVTSGERMSEIPEVPTTAELDFPELTISAWYGLFAPAGIPQDVKETLSEALVEITATDEWRGSLEAVRMSPAPDSTPEAFRALIASELERWEPIARAAVSDN